MQTLYSLAYFSRNAISEAGGDLVREIDRILAVARDNNRRQGVTGALLFSDGCFAQVLEGPLAAVEQVFETIQCDPRHRDVTVLSFEPITERAFANWSMAFAGTDAVVPGKLSGILPSADAVAGEPAGRDLIVVLRELIARHEAAESDLIR